MIFTDEERRLLTGLGPHLCIRGPRASGRTAALLLAAEDVIGRFGIPARRVLVLVPERAPEYHASAHRPTGDREAVTIQRLARRAPALQGARLATTAYLTWLLTPTTSNHFRNTTRSRYPANNAEFWGMADGWMRGAHAPTGKSLAEEEQVADRYLHAAEDIASRGYRKATDTERHLLTASRLSQGEMLEDFDLIVADDLHLFDPQDLPLLRALLTRAASRVLLTLLQDQFRGDAWWPRLVSVAPAQCTLGARAVRREVLDLLEALDPAARPLVSRLGTGGRVDIAPFQQAEDRRTASLLDYWQPGRPSPGEETTRALLITA